MVALLATSSTRSRRYYVLVAFAFCAALLFFWHPSASHVGSWKDGLNHGLETAQIWLRPVRAHFSENAHSLPDADSFTPHFKAVLDDPSIPSPAQLRETCTWTDKQEVDGNFMWGWDVSWRKELWSDEKILKARKEWQDFFRHGLVPYKSHASRSKGRGIVIAGGNGKSIVRIEVLLRALLKLKSETHVEIHYWKHEIPAGWPEEVMKWFPNIAFNDLSAGHNPFRVKYSSRKTDGEKARVNYHLKIAALLNSQFDEVLLLDSDNIPVASPEDVFDSPTYKEYGTVFWPDSTRTRAQNPIWGIMGTPCVMNEYEQESGQILVHKAKFWYHLQLSLWLMREEQVDTYGNILLGDKDAFRFAWKALKTPYGQPTNFLSSVGFKIADDQFCGIAFGQYHPDENRIAFLHANALKSHAPKSLKWVEKNLDGGVFGWVKKDPRDDDWSIDFSNSGRWDWEEYIPEGRGSTEFVAQCNDYKEVAMQKIEKVIEGGYEHIYQEIKEPYVEGDQTYWSEPPADG